MNQFPLAVRQLMETRKKWNPDDRILFLEIVNDMKAKVCTFKQGAYRQFSTRELISSKTFAEFPGWVVREHNDTDIYSSVIEKI